MVDRCRFAKKCVEQAGLKFNKTVDGPASGVAHKFPRRSYNLLLNYSLLPGPPRHRAHSLLSISPSIGMHASKIDAFAAAAPASIPRLEEPRDRFHSFHRSKIYRQFPSIQNETDTDRSRSPIYRPSYNSKIRQRPFPFLPLCPMPMERLYHLLQPSMNRRIWFNQGRLPKK